MRPFVLLTTSLLLTPVLTSAAVVELDSDDLVDVAVPGISIGQVVTDKTFDSDDQRQRDLAADRNNARDASAPSVSVSNAEALDAPPKLDTLIPNALASIDDEQTRDLTKDALTNDNVVRQNVLGVQLGVNQQALQAAGIDLANISRTPDPGSLRNSLMELLPSSAGYQFELMK